MCPDLTRPMQHSKTCKCCDEGEIVGRPFACKVLQGHPKAPRPVGDENVHKNHDIIHTTTYIMQDVQIEISYGEERQRIPIYFPCPRPYLL